MVERLVDSIGHGGLGAPPPIEVNAPFLQNENPAPAENNVEIERNIFFRVTDAPDDPTSGVDINTLLVQIQNDGGGFVSAIVGGVFQAGFSGTIVDVFSDTLSFDVDIDPVAFLEDGVQVDVRVQVSDTTIVGTQLDTTYLFNTEAAEANPPVISLESPAPAETGVFAGTNVTFRLTDVADQVDSGVDTSTLDVEIENGIGNGFVFAIQGGVFQAGFAGSIVDLGGGLSFDITINPDVDFLQLDDSRVRVNVDDTKTVPNSLSVTYTFSVAQTDASPPFVDNQNPAISQTGVQGDTNIFFQIHDAASGVDLSSLDVIVDINGSPVTAVLAGVIQAGFGGAIVAIGDGFSVTINPDTDIDLSSTVTITIDADDLAAPTPNSMVSVVYQFFTVFPQPLCVLAQTEFHALLGSIIQLDGRQSSSPDGATLTFTWKFVAVPSGSILEEDVELDNPDSIVELRPSLRAVSFIPDKTGTYIVELSVSNGGASTSCTVIVSVGLSLVPCGEGVVPDARFIWKFLSNFYDLVEDREYFSIMWSAAIQIAGADLTTLYSNDSNKSLQTIQTTVMRRWQQIKPVTDLLANPQSLIIGNTAAGTFGTTGTAAGTSPATQAFLDAPTPETYAVVGKVLKLQVDKNPPFGLTFTGTNPLTAAQVVSQINTASGVTVASVFGTTVRIFSSLFGDDSFIEVLGEDAAADFGWALNQTVQGVSSGLTRVFRAPLGDPTLPQEENFTLIDVNYGARGRIIDINGRGFTIDRVFNQSNAEVAADSVLTFDGAAFGDITVSAKEDEVNATIFAADNDYVYIGHVTPFDTIRVALATVAGGNLAPTFEASDGAAGWIVFAPTAEGTTGFTADGDITIDVTALLVAGWLVQSENGLSRYWVRIQRNNPAAITAPIEKTIKVVDSLSIVSLLSETLADGQKGVPYRIPHLLHTPGIDLELNGVSSGDTLVLEATRKDSNISAEFRAQVVTVDGERLGFEFDIGTITPGAQNILDHSVFQQLVQDLRLVSPALADADIAAVAEALIQLFPTGINLSTRPFSTYQIQVRAKKVIHNSFLKINDLIVGLPTLQEELKERPDFIFLEGTDYVLDAGYLVWQSGLFAANNAAPEELWAECAHIDNNPVIENNFGALVDLSQDDLVEKATRAPYLAAVKGLWFAITGSPSVANIRLALQILMGLPFSEARGIILKVDTTFTVDSSGDQIGRLLVEDVDDSDRPLGFRRFYFFPTAIGLDVNPNTGELFKVGDIIDPFVPISLGVEVEDHVNNSLWWVRNLVNEEIRKYHTFRAQIDTDSGVFDENDLVFSVQFLKTIKPVYSDLIASVLLRLEDDDILDNFVDTLAGSSTVLRFYDNVGAWGGHESTVRATDLNNQGFVLWRGDSRPFATRTTQLLHDVATAANGPAVEASAASFGSIRNRALGDLTHPTVEGDILVILQNQPGASQVEPGLYEITAGAPAGPLVLGNEASAQDPTTWDVNLPDSGLFPFGTALDALVARRALNPVVQGTNLETFGTDEAESAGSSFIDAGVAIDDHLIIESGAQEGEYRIVTMVAQTVPRDYTPTGVPQILADRVKLVDMDGVAVVLGAAVSQDFRIIRPAFQKNRIIRAQIAQSGGDMFAEVLDEGATAIPFDIFSPAMVGQGLNVQDAENPLNDGDYTILEYVHAGRVRITTGSPQTSDASPTAILTIASRFHPGFEKAEELAPLELFEAEVV